jgi:hypothetical protein
MTANTKVRKLVQDYVSCLKDCDHYDERAQTHAMYSSKVRDACIALADENEALRAEIERLRAAMPGEEELSALLSAARYALGSEDRRSIVGLMDRIDAARKGTP